MVKRIFALLTLWVALPVAAATYNFTGPLFTSHSDHTTCGTGTCVDYTTAMRDTGFFTTAAPIAANAINLDIRAAITGYSFNDGNNTIASGDPNARISVAQVSTDAAGLITAWDIRFQRWQTPGASHVVGDRINTINTNSSTPQNTAFNNGSCLTFSPGDVCSGFDVSITDASYATSFTLGSWTASGLNVVAAAIPSLSEWGVAILALIVLMLGTYTARRKSAN